MDKDAAKDAIDTLIAEFEKERKALASELADATRDGHKIAHKITACQARLDDLEALKKVIDVQNYRLPSKARRLGSFEESNRRR